jgi:hemoglobin-like flavoprotein
MTAPQSPIDPESLNAAHASYERASAKEEFFATFYANFFKICPDARPRFSQTNFERQHKLLHHAIGLLLIYPKQHGDQPNLLSRLAHRHGRKGMDIPAGMYPPFVDALILSLRQFDPAFTDELERAWRDILATGVAYMRSKY